MSERLFAIDEIPEVPLFRAPARRKGEGDARFQNDYPPGWDECEKCGGYGSRGTCSPGESLLDLRRRSPCPECLAMGSLKARVRLEAGHRCVRCKHPYIPKDDAKMLGVERSGLHDCERCEATGKVAILGGRDAAGEYPGAHFERCPDCRGEKRVWLPWSPCGAHCTHGGPLRVSYGPPANPDVWVEHLGEVVGDSVPVLARFENAVEVEAFWRILTVHHLDGDKANCRWWNLASLCQRCHLEIQAKVVMERIYPHEHSEWFKPYVAGYYAWVYLGEDLARPEVEVRMGELLALERDPAYT